jgi:Zn-dependent peptidase ImmA (M78 family)
MFNSENIKMDIFNDMKNIIIDILSPQNGNICFSENPSVDVEAIAKENGITDIQRILPVIVDNGQTFHFKHAVLVGTIIFVNIEDNPEKQRFSIAHEIFHFNTRQPGDFMKAVARRGEDWKKKNAGSAEAIEEELADYFAANLLIPTERFILWEDRPDGEIARAFQVEEKCIRKRREEIEMELGLMTPNDLSSDVNLEETAPLTPDEMDHLLEGRAIHDTGRV